jgi:tRNA threonylcarbamoyladenosine biosynthesis protein TsaB
MIVFVPRLSSRGPRGMSNTGSPDHQGSATGDSGAAGRKADRTLVLAVDTATDARSVCVARGRETLSLVKEGQTKAGASVVLSLIDGALRSAGVKFEELELFAVACGPGSFTGIRAGVATVKAFAAMTGRPVAPVPTLHAVALAAGPSARTVAAIPAGRGEVFTQLLEVESCGAVRELNGPAHVSPAKLTQAAAGWGQSLVWVGGGAWANRELIAEAAKRAGREWIEPSDARQTPTVDGGHAWSLAPRADSYGEQIARLSLISTERGETVRADEVRALYVRPSDAELK